MIETLALIIIKRYIIRNPEAREVKVNAFSEGERE
jgi:hypothetical protein